MTMYCPKCGGRLEVRTGVKSTFDPSTGGISECYAFYYECKECGYEDNVDSFQDCEDEFEFGIDEEKLNYEVNYEYAE